MGKAESEKAWSARQRLDWPRSRICIFEYVDYNYFTIQIVHAVITSHFLDLNFVRTVGDPWARISRRHQEVDLYRIL
jgi:hypothetical protein